MSDTLIMRAWNAYCLAAQNYQQHPTEDTRAKAIEAYEWFKQIYLPWAEGQPITVH